MNDSLKNILPFIKEVLELRNKNIYTVSDYEMHIDLGAFYKKFRELVEVQNYLSYSINKEETVFKLRYINEESKKAIPKVPNDLVRYIFLEDGNIELKDDSEDLLKDELYASYQEYCNRVKEVKVYNNLINTYNELYMSLYNVFKRIKDYEEKIEIIFGQKLLLWRDYQGNEIKRYILEANLNIDVDSVNNVITLDIDKDKFRGFVTDFFNLEEYKVKDIVTLNEFVREFNEEFIAEGKDYDIDECVKEYINYAALENEIAGFELSENQEIKINKTYIFENCGIIVRRKNVKLWIEDLEKTIQSYDDVNIVSPILKMFEIASSDEEKISELINDTTYNDTKDEEVLFPLPSNDEQYKIVDKVKASNIVLVQGPPGTGKSHTIANLVSHYISEGKRVIVTSEKAKALEVLREKIPEKIRSLSLSLLTSAGIDNNLENSVNSIIKHQQDEQELKANESLIEKLYSELKDTQRKKQEAMQKIVEIMAKDTQAYRLQDVIDIEEFDELSLMDIAKWLQKNRQYKLIPLEDIENFKYSGVNDFFEKLDDIADEIKNNCYAISSSIPINNYLQNNEIELHIKERIKYKNYKLHNLELFNVVKQEAIKERQLVICQ